MLKAVFISHWQPIKYNNTRSNIKVSPSIEHNIVSYACHFLRENQNSRLQYYKRTSILVCLNVCTTKINFIAKFDI